MYHIVYYVFGPECDPPLYVAKNITIHQGIVLRNRSILKGHNFKIVLYYIIYYIVYYIVYYIIYCIINIILYIIFCFILEDIALRKASGPEV